MSYLASLLHWKSLADGAGYVLQMPKCISLPIMHYGNSLFIGHNIVLCKEPDGSESSLIDNLPHNPNLCEKEYKL